MKSQWEDIQKTCTNYTGLTWSQICYGLYPQNILDRYFEKLVTKKSTYILYQLETMAGHRLLLGNLNEAIECVKVIPKDMHTFDCHGEGKGEVREMKTDLSIMACLGYRFDMVEELLESCGKKNDTEGIATVLYYANIEDRLKYLKEHEASSGTLLYASSVVIVILSMVLVCLLLRKTLWNVF